MFVQVLGGDYYAYGITKIKTISLTAKMGSWCHHKIILLSKGISMSTKKQTITNIFTRSPNTRPESKAKQLVRKIVAPSFAS